MTAVAHPQPHAGDAAAPASRAPSVGALGMILLIATEAALFGALLSAYFYLRVGAEPWPPAGIEPPEKLLVSIGTVLLLSSSIPLARAQSAIARGDRGRSHAYLAVAWVMGAGFLGIQAHEYLTSTFRPDTGAYGSLFFTITGAHGAHLLIGL
jgi:heme/copper-type cytochrome/quinol oxidase subunit 3